MDGTENEHPDVDVKGFPTIILFPAGKDAAPIPYEGGDRSLKVRATASDLLAYDSEGALAVHADHSTVCTMH